MGEKIKIIMEQDKEGDLVRVNTDGTEEMMTQWYVEFQDLDTAKKFYEVLGQEIEKRTKYVQINIGDDSNVVI